MQDYNTAELFEIAFLFVNLLPLLVAVLLAPAVGGAMWCVSAWNRRVNSHKVAPMTPYELNEFKNYLILTHMMADEIVKIFKINDLPTPDSKFTDYILTTQTTLQLWNSKINISKNDFGDRFLIENILDPIKSCQHYMDFDEDYLLERLKNHKTLKLIDLGCGGGFVGIFWTAWILKYYPTMMIETILFDSLRKRISFCAELVRGLGLADKIHCIHGRAETLPRDLVGDFDLVLSRATWAFDEFLNFATPFSKIGGRMVSFEGPSGLVAIQKMQAKCLEYKVLPSTHPRYLGCIFKDDKR